MWKINQKGGNMCMKEDIKSFVSQSDEELPFFIDMAGISYCDGSYHICRPSSSIYCFEYILEGTGVVKTRGEEFHPSKGDVYFLHAGDNHDYYSDSLQPWTKIWFNAKGPLLETLIQAYGLTDVNFMRSCNVSRYFQQILDIVNYPGLSIFAIMNQSALVFHNLLQSLWAYHYGRQKEVNISEPAARVKKYLDLNIEKKISIGELANLNFLSPSQIIRVFKKTYGISPYDYLLQRKMELACLLLCNSHLMIREIAFKIGFSDEHYFSSAFKKNIGLSPREYRKQFFTE